MKGFAEMMGRFQSKRNRGGRPSSASSEASGKTAGRTGGKGIGRRLLPLLLILTLVLPVWPGPGQGDGGTVWAAGANAGLVIDGTNRNPQVIFPDDNFPSPKPVKTIEDVEWTKVVNRQGFDSAYTSGKSKQYNGTSDSHHVVIKNDNSVNFYGYNSSPNCDYVYSDKYNNLHSLNFTIRPVAMNLHTFAESGFLFNGKMSGNTFTGYALALECTKQPGVGFFGSGGSKGEAVLGLYKGSWDMSSGAKTIDPGRRIATYATVSGGSSSAYTVSVTIDPATRFFSVSINGQVKSNIKEAVSVDQNGFGFFTSYWSHNCSTLTVMRYDNTKITMIQPSSGNPYDVLQKVNATVKYLNNQGNGTIKTSTIQQGYVGQGFTVTAPQTIRDASNRTYTLVKTSEGERLDPKKVFTYNQNADKNVISLYYVLSGPKGSISGKNWIDNNGNGKLDSGERLMGVGFLIYKAEDLNFERPLTYSDLFGAGSGNDIYSAASNRTNGEYTMNDIPAGKYSIRPMDWEWGGQEDGFLYHGICKINGTGVDNKAVSVTAADGKNHPYTIGGRTFTNTPTKPTIQNVVISTNGQKIENQGFGATIRLVKDLVATPSAPNSGSSLTKLPATINYGIQIWAHIQNSPDLTDRASSNTITQILPEGMSYSSGSSKVTVKETSYTYNSGNSWDPDFSSKPAPRYAFTCNGTNISSGKAMAVNPVVTTLADGRVQLKWTVDQLGRGDALLISFDGLVTKPGYYATNFVMDATGNPGPETSKTIAFATGIANYTEKYRSFEGDVLKAADTTATPPNAGTYAPDSNPDSSKYVTKDISFRPPGSAKTYTYVYKGYLLGDAEYTSFVNGTVNPSTGKVSTLRTAAFSPVNGNMNVYLMFDEKQVNVTEQYRVVGNTTTPLKGDTHTSTIEQDPYYLQFGKTGPLQAGGADYTYYGYSVNGTSPIYSADVPGDEPGSKYQENALIDPVTGDINYVVHWYRKNPQVIVRYRSIHGDGTAPGTTPLKSDINRNVPAGDMAYFDDAWAQKFALGQANYSYYGYALDDGPPVTAGPPTRELGVLSTDLVLTLYFANVREATVHFIEYGNPYLMVGQDRNWLLTQASWDPSAVRYVPDDAPPGLDAGLYDDLYVAKDPGNPAGEKRRYVYRGYAWLDGSDNPGAVQTNAILPGAPAPYTGTADAYLALYFTAYYDVTIQYHENTVPTDTSVPMPLLPDDHRSFLGGTTPVFSAPPAELYAGGSKWTLAGYKPDDDYASVASGSPNLGPLNFDRTLIYAYKKTAAAANTVSMTERFREAGNESNILRPNNLLTVTGKNSAGKYSYGSAPGVPPPRLTDSRTGLVFALAGYAWGDVDYSATPPGYTVYVGDAPVKRDDLDGSGTITYLYTARRAAFTVTCNGTAADSTAANRSSTQATLVYDNPVRGSLAFSDVTVTMKDKTGADVNVKKTGATDFANAARISAGVGGGWDGKTWVVDIEPVEEALEGDLLTVSATITEDDPSDPYYEFPTVSAQGAVHILHQINRIRTHNETVGSDLLTTWITVTLTKSQLAIGGGAADPSNHAFPMTNITVGGIRIVPDGPGGGIALPVRVVPRDSLADLDVNPKPEDATLGDNAADGYRFSIALGQIIKPGNVLVYVDGLNDPFRTVGDPVSVEVKLPGSMSGSMNRYQFIQENGDAYGVNAATNYQSLPDFTMSENGGKVFPLRVGKAITADAWATSDKYVDYEGTDLQIPAGDDLSDPDWQTFLGGVWRGEMVSRSFTVGPNPSSVPEGTYPLFSDGADDVVRVSSGGGYVYWIVDYEPIHYQVIGYYRYRGDVAKLAPQTRHPEVTPATTPPSSTVRKGSLYVDGALLGYVGENGDYLENYGVFDGSGAYGPGWFTSAGYASIPNTSFFYLKPNLLLSEDRLKNGRHTVLIVFADGYALGEFVRAVHVPANLYGETLEVVRGGERDHKLLTGGDPVPAVGLSEPADLPENSRENGMPPGVQLSSVYGEAGSGTENTIVSYMLKISAAATKTAKDLDPFWLTATGPLGDRKTGEFLIRVIDRPGAPDDMKAKEVEAKDLPEGVESVPARGAGDDDGADGGGPVTASAVEGPEAFKVMDDTWIHPEWKNPTYLGNTELLGFAGKITYYSKESGKWSDWTSLPHIPALIDSETGALIGPNLSGYYIRIPDGISAYGIQIWAYNKVGAGPPSIYVHNTSGAPAPPSSGTPEGPIGGSVTNNTGEEVDVVLFLERGDKRISDLLFEGAYAGVNDEIDLRDLEPGAVVTFLFDEVPIGYYNVVAHVMPTDNPGETTGGAIVTTGAMKRTEADQSVAGTEGAVKAEEAGQSGTGTGVAVESAEADQNRTGTEGTVKTEEAVQNRIGTDVTVKPAEAGQNQIETEGTVKAKETVQNQIGTGGAVNPAEIQPKEKSTEKTGRFGLSASSFRRDYYVTRGAEVDLAGEAGSNIDIELSRRQSVVEVRGGAPQVSVRGLPGLFDSDYYTEEDAEFVSQGGLVEFKLIVTRAAGGDVQALEEKARTEKERLMESLDLSITKTRYSADGIAQPGYPVHISNPWSLGLTLALPLEGGLERDDDLSLYRLHKEAGAQMGTIEKFQKEEAFDFVKPLEKTEDMVYNRSDLGDWLVAHSRKFSAFGITVPVWQLTTEVIGEGRVTGAPADPLLAEREIVGLVAVAAEGWAFKQWQLSGTTPSAEDDATGAMAFIMPGVDVKATAVFEALPGSGDGDPDPDDGKTPDDGKNPDDGKTPGGGKKPGGSKKPGGNTGGGGSTEGNGSHENGAGSGGAHPGFGAGSGAGSGGYDGSLWNDATTGAGIDAGGNTGEGASGSSGVSNGDGTGDGHGAGGQKGKGGGFLGIDLFAAGGWSLLNLILAAGGLALATVVLLRRRRANDGTAEREEVSGENGADKKEEGGQRRIVTLSILAPALLGALLFPILEETTGPVCLIDVFTPLFVVIFAAEIFLIVFLRSYCSHRRRREPEEIA